MPGIETIVTVLVSYGPWGGIAAIVLYMIAFRSDKEKKLIDSAGTKDEQHVKAFATVVQANTQLIKDQNDTLRAITKEMAEDRAFHRSVMEGLTTRVDRLEGTVEKIQDGVEKIASKLS